jgi:hypothetical protein
MATDHNINDWTLESNKICVGQCLVINEVFKQQTLCSSSNNIAFNVIKSIIDLASSS